METLSNEFVQNFLFEMRQKLGSMMQYISRDCSEEMPEEDREEFQAVCKAFNELKRDCEQTLSIAELLFEHKTRIEFESETLENMSEHIQKLEEENERQRDYARALETEHVTCRADIEQLENENSKLETEKAEKQLNLRKLKKSLDLSEQTATSAERWKIIRKFVVFYFIINIF